MLGDDQRQHGVTEQRELFVVGARRMFVGERGVGQRADEQRAITKPIAERLLEPAEPLGLQIRRRDTS